MCTAICRPLSCASTGKVRSVHLFPVLNLPHKFFKEVSPSLCLLCNSALHYSAFWNTARTAFVLTLVLFDASR